jgi:hypothetical protein
MALVKVALEALGGAKKMDMPATKAISPTTPPVIDTSDFVSNDLPELEFVTGAGAGADMGGAFVRLWPHSSQNSASSTFLWPHWVQKIMIVPSLLFIATATTKQVVCGNCCLAAVAGHGLY